ncbi:MAG: glycosyltransferase family 4 protein [Candidatus Promineifilaceae bacterium]
MKQPLRVLLLSADYLPDVWSGIGVAVANQARALAGAGAAVTVLLGSRRPRRKAAEVPGVTLRPLTAGRCPVNPADFDVIHLHSLALAELALEMKRRLRRPLVYTAHSLLPLELAGAGGRLRRFWAAVQAHLFRECDFVIFLNEGERRAALAALPGLARRSAVIRHAVAPALSRPEGRRPELILFAGRFSADKGLALLAELAARVLKERPCDFLLVGGHGDPAGQRAANCLARRHAEHCRILPWLPHETLQALLGRAALVLIPSRYEPFGLVALEAMRAGTPVLAAAAGGLSETLGPGSGGRLVSAPEPGLWAAETLALLAAPAERAALGRQGPAYVAANFNQAEWAQTLMTKAYG